MTKTPNGIMAHDVYVDRITDRLVKKCDLADVGGSLLHVKELIDNSAENYIEEYKPPHGVIAFAIEQAYKKGAIDMYKYLSQ